MALRTASYKRIAFATRSLTRFSQFMYFVGFGLVFTVKFLGIPGWGSRFGVKTPKLCVKRKSRRRVFPTLGSLQDIPESF